MPARWREVVNCPHCGAENPSIEARCAACSKGLVVYIGPAHHLPRRFGLGSLMVLVATIAVGLGALRFAPFLGIMLLALVPASVVRTTAVINQRRVDGRPMGFDAASSVFFGSIGVMLAVLVAMFVAFTIVCMPVGAIVTSGARGWERMPYAIAISGGVALLVGAWLLRRLWPHKG